jgi:hypothetical protein
VNAVPFQEFKSIDNHNSKSADAPRITQIVTPYAVSRRQYKNQPAIAVEQTLKFNIPAADCQTEANASLLNLLRDAKILSSDIIEGSMPLEIMLHTEVFASRFPFLQAIMDSLRSLSTKIAYGAITHEQGVVAANQLFLTGSCLADSLAMVGARSSYTVVDFLREGGVDLTTYDEGIDRISESRLIIDRLIALDCVDEQTIRVATRLRYLVCQRKLTCENAWKMFAYYVLNKFEGERIIDQTTCLAA